MEDAGFGGVVGGANESLCRGEFSYVEEREAGGFEKGGRGGAGNTPDLR